MLLKAGHPWVRFHGPTGFFRMRGDAEAKGANCGLYSLAPLIKSDGSTDARAYIERTK